MRMIGSALLDRMAPDGARQALKLDFIASILAGLFSGAVFPFAGKIMRDNLHASVFEIALLASAPCLGSLISPIWANRMNGRNKMPFVKWCFSGGRALLLLMAFITSPLLFVIVISFAQIVPGIGIPAYSTLMKEIYPDRVRGHCMGLVRVGSTAAIFLVALLAGRILDMHVYAFHWVFPIAGLLGVVSAFTFAKIESDPIDADSNYKPTLMGSLHLLVENKRYGWFSLAVFIFGIGNLVATPAMVLHQVDNLHIQNSNIALLVNITSLTAIPFYFIWGKYLDRRGPVRAVWLNILLSALVPVVYLYSRDWRTLMLASILAGITNSGIDLSYLNSILDFADDDKIPQYQSVHSFLFGVRGTIAPFLGGALIHLSDTTLNPFNHPEWSRFMEIVSFKSQASADGTYLAPVFVVATIMSLAGAVLLGVRSRKQYALQ